MAADFGDDMSEMMLRKTFQLIKEIARYEWNNYNKRQAVREEYFIDSDYKGFRDNTNEQGEAVSEFCLTTADERDGVLKYLQEKDVEVEPVDTLKIVFDKKDMGQVEDAVRMYREDLVAASEIEMAELKAIEQAMYAMEDAIELEKVLDEQLLLPQKIETKTVSIDEMNKVVNKANVKNVETIGMDNEAESLAERAKNYEKVSKALEQGKASIARDKTIDKGIPTR